MSKLLIYEDDLKSSLNKLFEIKLEMKTLKQKEDKIKDQVKKWMVLNELDKFNVEDANNHKWSIGKYTNRRQTIIDLKLLKSLISESEYPLVIKETESEYYKISSPELSWEKD